MVRRLCGVQAQVASSAELAVGLRCAAAQPGAVEQGLRDKTLMKTWAMRGTLHALPTDEAAAYLTLLAAARTWEKPAWQRAFVTAGQLAKLTDAAAELLDGRVLSREELIAGVLARTGDAGLAEQLGSGWGAVLKPLAWQGYLCHGPSQGNRITFTRPDSWLPGWRGPGDPAEAARHVVPAYLGAYGPASPETFDQWLCRGASKKSALKGWFAQLGTELVSIEVEGQRLHARSSDVDSLATIRPREVVRLLPGFDQYVLGPGTADPQIIPAGRRNEVSRAGGWISPVVVAGGRVAGTWQTTGEVLEVALFAEAGRVSAEALEAETARIAALRGAALTLSVRTG